jgi:small subunit ribosomal protein S17
MPKTVAVGVVTKDSATKTRRVEVPRLVGDTVEIVEARPFSKTKRWELVRVVTKSQAVDLAALRAASRAIEQQELDARQQPTAETPQAGSQEQPPPQEEEVS